MSPGGGLFEVVLRGGQPWGFTLSGGTETGNPLFVAAIEPGGKADRCRHLQILDHLISVQNRTVHSHHEAVQAIRGALGTLTLTIQRGHSGSSASSPGTPQDALIGRRQDTPGRTQDDSVVYAESKAKEGSTRRPKRRGASFSLRTNNNTTSRTPSWTAPPGDQDHRGATYGSVGNHSQTPSLSAVAEGNHHHSNSAVSTRKMYSTKSTPSLQYYTSDGTDAATPAALPNSQSWHSQIGATDNSRASMKKAYSQSMVMNSVPKPYRPPSDFNSNLNKENLPARFGQSDTDVSRHNHGHTASFSSTGSWHHAPSSSSASSSSRRDYENVDSYRVVPDSDMDKSPVDSSSSSMSSSYQQQRSASPPMPPTRDASSLRYIKVSQSHEKYPSWPVTQAATTNSSVEAPDVSALRAMNSRTNSWSDTTHTSSEFPNKPRMAYQPQLNTHQEERMSPTTMRRYFEEKRIRSSKDEFDERVATELRGVDVDIKKDFPMDAKGKLDISGVKGSDLSYPLPQMDKDGRYREDKNYAIPSPPQRDGSPVRYLFDRLEAASPPPPLPDNSPPKPVTDSMSIPQDYSVKPAQGSGYPYVIRQRAFYNTSTQTELKNAETQANVDQHQNSHQPKAKIRREEKSVQARPGSIVSHSQQQTHRTQGSGKSEDSDYERLIFNRESVGVGPDSPASPGVRPNQSVIEDNNRQPNGTETSTNFKENVFAQIKEHSQDDTVMLRRLSQEYFNKGQSQYAQNPQHQRLLVNEAKPRRSLDSQQHHHSRQSSLSSDVSSRSRHLSSDGRVPQEKEDKVADLPSLPKKDQNQYFDRNKSANMSLRKAYGLFDGDGTGRAQKNLFGPSAKTASTTEADKSKEGTPPKKSGKKSKSKKNPETRESKVIAEKARKEWEKSDRSKSAQDLGRLKRTTSEQIRPMKERLQHEKHEANKYSHPPKTIDNHRRKSSDPAHPVHIVHRRTGSTDVQRVEDFLCNSPLSRQRRMGSSDMPQGIPGATENLLSPSATNRPPSSQSSTSSDHQRNTSDPELKKVQQQALLNFFEKKNADPPRRGQYSPSADLQTHHKKSVSLPRDAKPMYHSSHDDDDMPSPPLLDTTKELSPAKRAVSPSKFTFQTEYSPPPHPWKDSEGGKSRSWSLNSPQPPEAVSPGRGATDKQLNRSRSRSEEETHPKAIEASMSASSPSQSPMETSTTQKYAYQITVNQNYSPKDSTSEDASSDKPPVLPPRNYRGGGSAKGRPSLEPPPSPVGPANGEMNNNKHVSQVNVRFTSDYDMTPKVDSYADQLRQQSRRISQSQSSLLMNPTAAARYQNKPVPETKTAISKSRPVDKPPTPQEARVPLIGSVYGKPENDVSRGYVKPAEMDIMTKSQESRVPLHNFSKSVDEYSTESSSTHSKDGRTLIYSKSTDEPPSQKERNPLDNIRATIGPVSPRSPSNQQIRHSPGNSYDMTNNPQQIRHSPANSFDNQLPIRHSPANSFDKSYETSPKEPWMDQKNARPHHLSLSAETTSQLPPPPPPKNLSPPDHRKLEDKPLPPAPPTSEVPDDTNGDTTPTSARYSSESYLYNRGTTRQGFGGNYHRRDELSPSSPPGTYDNETNNNTESHDTDIMAADQPLRQLSNKPYMEPPWGKRTFYPATTTNNKQSPRSASPNSHSESNSTITGSQDEDTDRVESPSVKSCIANFESWSPRSQRKFGQSQIGRTKIQNLRETFMRKSNENLSELDDSTSQLETSSRSRSNESLDERLSSGAVSTTKSTENLNKSTTVSPGRDRVLVKSPNVSDTSLVLNLDNVPPPPKPTSPTLESGYNSHTPDNRSLISELSSGSNPSRNGSNVSKDSIDIPTSQSVTVVHVRQKSMEEIECEKQAAIVVSQLPDSEKRKVSEVILPPPQHKTSTDYMCGIFDTHVDYNRKPSAGSKGSSPSNQSNTTSATTATSGDETLPVLELDLPASSAYWSPPSIAQLQNRMRQEGRRTEDLLKESQGASLASQKEELVSRIDKKLSILQDERRELENEMDENNDLGKQVSLSVEQKASSCHEFNKYQIYLHELDTVLKLLLKVSGQLARAENAVMSLGAGGDGKEKRALIAKRDDLSQKHEDAKQLKEGIDLRSHQVAAQLRRCLTAEEFKDYEYFLKMKSKLKMEQQEIDDKISLGEEQLAALKKLL